MDIQFTARPHPTATMNAPLLPEVLLGVDPLLPTRPPPAAADVQRHVWHSRFGSMLIEVKGDTVFVNGQPVEPHVAAGPAAR